MLTRVSGFVIILMLASALTLLPNVHPTSKAFSCTLTPEVASRTKNAFIVGIDPNLSWRDMAVLATVPVASTANGRKPIVLLSPRQKGQVTIDDSVKQFLEMYNPDSVYYVGVSNITQRNRVLFDEAHNEWTSIEGNYKQFANSLREQGYIVERITSNPITYDILKEHDAYVVGTAWGGFSQSEIDAVLQFVAGGGGIFLTGLGWSWVDPAKNRTMNNYPMNLISKNFGIEFLEDGVCDPTDHYGTSPYTPIFHKFAIDHPIIQNIHQVGGPISPTALKGLTTGPQKVVFGDEDAYAGSGYPAGTHPPLVMTTTYGQGRVVCLGHEGYLSTDDYDGNGVPNVNDYDNLQLGLNIIKWLTQSLSQTLPNTITGNNEIELASNLAEKFWNSSEDIVLASNTDYKGSLLASLVASRLSAPLLYFDPTNLASLNQNVIASLGATKAVVVGNCSSNILTELQNMRLNVLNLSNEIAVAKYLTTIDPINYTVIVNPSDRFSLGKVPRLSLLSPILAAYRNGVVYTADYDVQWKIPFFANVLTTSKPSGSSDGGNRTFFCTELSDQSPPRSSAATWQIYPANGKYAVGKLPLIAGTYSHDISFYLGVSHQNALKYDVVLIDVNEDKLISNNEVFYKNVTFTVNSRTYIINEISGDGSWGGAEEFLQLKFNTWKNGILNINGKEYPFVLTSTGYGTGEIGCYDTANIDLNHNGQFNDIGEGPFHSSDTVNLSEKKYVLTVGVGENADAQPGDLKLTYPDARVITKELTDFFASSNLNPLYLAILGYYDAVPFSITFKPYPDVEDMVSDITYGNIDNDTFVDISVGRLFASDVYKASALIARIISYSDLLNPYWMNKSLTIADQGENEALAKTTEHNLRNVGFNTTGLYENYDWSNIYLQNKSIILHDGHAYMTGWSGGPWSPSIREIWLAPSLAISGGCLTAGLDFTTPQESIVTAFLDRGAIAYIGNTRPSSNPIFSYLGIFFDGLIYRGLTLGEAHRRGQNLKLIEYIKENNRYPLIAAHEVTLFGDPAQPLYFPSPPVICPANTRITSINSSELTVVYAGPGTWWLDEVRNYEGRTLYSRSGPGTFFVDFMDKVKALIYIRFSGELVNISQDTILVPPLGWTGEYYVDREWRNETSVYWILQPVRYDINDGTIGQEAAYIKYTVRIVPCPVHSLATDLNRDRKVNIEDIFIIAKAYGTKPGDKNWNAIADINGDGLVNIYDIFLIARDYGKSL